MSIMICKNCTRHIDTDFEPMEGELCLRCAPDDRTETVEANSQVFSGEDIRTVKGVGK